MGIHPAAASASSVADIEIDRQSHQYRDVALLDSSGLEMHRLHSLEGHGHEVAVLCLNDAECVLDGTAVRAHHDLEHDAAGDARASQALRVIERPEPFHARCPVDT